MNNSNCKTKINCPLNGLCNLNKCSISRYYFPQRQTLKIKQNYIGISLVRWKLRFNNHIYSFSHEHLKNQTALSKHFWKLKNRGLKPKNSMENSEKIYYS